MLSIQKAHEKIQDLIVEIFDTCVKGSEYMKDELLEIEQRVLDCKIDFLQQYLAEIRRA